MSVRLIQVRPSRNLSWQKQGGWEVFEADGVSPVYCGDQGRESALSYARQRAEYGRADIQLFNEAGNVVDTISNEDLRPVVQGLEPWRSVADIGMTTVSSMYTAVTFVPSRDISFKRVPVGITAFPYWTTTSNGAVSVTNCSTGLGVVEDGDVSGLAALAVFGKVGVETNAGFFS